MIELIHTNWPLFVIALLIGIAVAWLVFIANRKTKVDTDTSDVLDEGRGPAARNQALIDADPAASAGTAIDDVDETAIPVATYEQLEPSAPAPVATKATGTKTTGTGVDTGSGQDDLTRIKGLGPKLVTILSGLGITSFAQIAVWDEADIDRIDAQLGRFEGRIRRDNWTEQAKLLGADDMAAYQAKFGKL